MACLHHIDASKQQDPNQAAYDALIKDYKLTSDGSSIEKMGRYRCPDFEYQQKVDGALAHI